MTHLLIDADSLIVGTTQWPNGYWVTADRKYVHRAVIEEHLGRSLVGQECVHHINRDPNDNRLENLKLCANNAEHRALHAWEDCERAGYDPNLYSWCSGHQQYELKERFSFAATWNGLHNHCREHTNAYRKAKGYKNVWTEELKLKQQQRRAAAKCTS